MPTSPVTVSNTFGPQAGPIALSQLDTNFTQLLAALNNLNAFNNPFVDTGAVNSMVITPAGGLAVALAFGLAFEVQVGHTNTSATVTLNAGGTGVKNVLNGDLTQPAVGQLVANSIVRLVYDGTQYQIVGGLGSFSRYISAPGSGPGLTVAPSDVVARGVAQARYVTVTTDNVTSSIALITDPYLQLPLPVGVYAFDLNLYNGGASTAGGLRFQMAFSGTATTSGWQAIGVANAVPTTVGRQAFGAPVIWTNTWGTTDFVLIKGSLQVTVAGTLSLQWAQQASNATSTNLGITSSLLVTPVS